MLPDLLSLETLRGPKSQRHPGPKDKFLQLLGEDANSSRVLNHFLNEAGCTSTDGPKKAHIACKVEVPAVFFHSKLGRMLL